MCSLTFLPRTHGYLLAMNRDENLERETALPPRVHAIAGKAWIGPVESSSGGTWIATSAAGATLTLLNAHPRHTIPSNPAGLISRGLLIPTLITALDGDELSPRLAAMTLSRFRPFRVVAIFPEERLLRIHNWDGYEIAIELRPWSLQQVFSSGMSDEMATTTRGSTAQTFAKGGTETDEAWVRRLHRSHAPDAGAFSYCVHRVDVETVSYTEVAVEECVITMRYGNGSPCKKRGGGAVGRCNDAYEGCDVGLGHDGQEPNPFAPSGTSLRRTPGTGAVGRWFPRCRRYRPKHTEVCRRDDSWAYRTQGKEFSRFA